MKKIFLLAIFVASLIACANTSSKDNKITSQPMVAENISTGDTLISFNDSPIDNIPDGFTVTSTGDAKMLNWKVVDDNGDKVVAQLAKNSGGDFNLLVLNKPGFLDFSMTVKIKAIAGNEDQGGGLVWRYVDNNNYYVARYNPLEDNFRFYRIVNGWRKELKSSNIHIKTGEWFTMKIEMEGNKITCLLNGKPMMEATDNTFPVAGRVGFWTKADAQSYFKDFAIHGIN